MVAGYFLYNPAAAQVRVGVNVNIGSQPAWGPRGYDYAEYYYLPDIDAYYYVPRRQFIYFYDGRWIFSSALPPRYRGYDLYRGYKVVINDPRPYIHHDLYRNRYAQYRGHYGQEVIRGRDYDRDRDRDRDRGRDDRYNDYRDHPGNNGRGHAYGHEKHHHDD